MSTATRTSARAASRTLLTVRLFWTREAGQWRNAVLSGAVLLREVDIRRASSVVLMLVMSWMSWEPKVAASGRFLVVLGE